MLPLSKNLPALMHCPFIILGKSGSGALSAGWSMRIPITSGPSDTCLSPRPAGVFSAGRVQNIAMLALAGKRVLTYDDDYVVDRCRQHAEADVGVFRIAGERAHCLQGFATGADMFGASEDLQLNPMAEHEALLGRTLSSVLNPVQQMSQSVCLAGVAGPFARRLNPDSRILTTGNGVMGKPIAPDGLLGWFAGGDTSPVWAPGKDYQAWLEGDHVFTSHKSPTISQTTFGIPVGIDNSTIMPPTLPEGRREDSLFTFMLHHAIPPVCILNSPGLSVMRETPCNGDRPRWKNHRQWPLPSSSC